MLKDAAVAIDDEDEGNSKTKNIKSHCKHKELFFDMNTKIENKKKVAVDLKSEFLS